MTKEEHDQLLQEAMADAVDLLQPRVRNATLGMTLKQIRAQIGNPAVQCFVCGNLLMFAVENKPNYYRCDCTAEVVLSEDA